MTAIRDSKKPAKVAGKTTTKTTVAPTVPALAPAVVPGDIFASSAQFAPVLPGIYAIVELGSGRTIRYLTITETGAEPSITPCGDPHRAHHAALTVR